MSRLSPVLATGSMTGRTAAAAARFRLRFRLGPIRRLLERSTDASTSTTAAGGTPRAINTSTSNIGTSAPGLSISPPSSASAAASCSWFGPSAAAGAAAPAGRSRTLLTAHEKTS